MKKFVFAVLLALIPFVAFAGKSRIVQLSPDTYLLVKQNFAGAFGNLSKTKIEAIQDAAEFAAKQGKIAIPLSTNEIPARPGQFPTIEYQFRVVDKNDPEAERTSLEPRADVVVKVEQPSGSVPAPAAAIKPDLYSELIKLDDLRKRGIISDSEFESMKAKLLAQ